MELQQFISPCHFGMEAILKREIYDLGYDIVKVEDGRVTYEGDMETICRANCSLNCIQMGRSSVSFHSIAVLLVLLY